MPPVIASCVCVIGIAGLIWLDHDRTSRTSPALWIPIIWMFIGASRMASQWLGIEPLDAMDTTLEGSPFDRIFLMGLLVAGLMVLAARAQRTGVVIGANMLLFLFFCYCALSVLWSDFPFVAVKRFTKALGNLTMVLVVLTERDPAAAVKRFLARSGFLLIPLSVLLIKYYPVLGRVYNRWTWEVYFTGVSADKNGLGGICLIIGLGSLWRLVEEARLEAGSRAKGVLAAHGVLLAMSLWLFGKADSSTALACFFIGAMLIVMTTPLVGREPAYVHLVVTMIAVFIASGFLLPNAYTYVIEALGRNTTLTGRTEIWSDLFRMDVNPLIGRGFESFWLGARADYVANKYYFHPNQAHNGYIETYLNLGWIGVSFLVVLIALGYQRIVDAFHRNSRSSTLRLAFLITIAAYNVTEATFKVMHPLWIVFLLAITSWPTRQGREEDAVFPDCPAAESAT